MIQIDRVEALQFDRVMPSGRTTPLLLTCKQSDGRLLETVTKFAGTRSECTTSALCAELIASQLAADLGLPTPQPVIVTWDDLFAGSLANPEARAVVAQSQPPAFGSSLVTDGFGTWPADRKLVGEELRQTALATFFFDAMIGNPDRRVMKPNILSRGDHLRLIDHEMAFNDHRVLLSVRPPPPWKLDGFYSLVSGEGAHIFAAQLGKAAEALDFAAIYASWASLSNEQIESYAEALPTEWTADTTLQSFAVRRIKDCREHINECITECRRVLNAGT